MLDRYNIKAEKVLMNIDIQLNRNVWKKKRFE
jgi:hypothetical protein